MGLKATVAAHLGEIDAREINSIPIGAGADGVPIVARVGRYGPYLQRGDDRASLPDDLVPRRADHRPGRGAPGRTLQRPGARAPIPRPGCDVQVKAGRFGPYVQVGDAGDGGDKPRTSSLFSTMDPATLTLEQALELLRIPRTVGQDPESGDDVVAHNGKFGPVPQAGDRHPQPGQRGPAAHGDAWKRPRPSSPNPSSAAAAPPPRRCASWAPTRPPSCPWSSRRAASAPT